MNHFHIGFADRTLGLGMADKNRPEGARLRSRLTRLGLWRQSGHEHFNGCIVVPFHDEAGNVVSFYGRRTSAGYVKHRSFGLVSQWSSECWAVKAVWRARTISTARFFGSRKGCR